MSITSKSVFFSYVKSHIPKQLPIISELHAKITSIVSTILVNINSGFEKLKKVTKIVFIAIKIVSIAIVKTCRTLIGEK